MERESPESYAQKEQYREQAETFPGRSVNPFYLNAEFASAIANSAPAAGLEPRINLETSGRAVVCKSRAGRDRTRRVHLRH